MKDDEPWTSDDVFTIIGMITSGLVLLGLLSLFVFTPINAGWWALDRFTHPYEYDSVVLRQDEGAEPLYICADGTHQKPLNCLSAQEIVKIARQRSRK